MRARSLLAALVLSPLVALAEDAPRSTAVPPPAAWSLGAGLGFEVIGFPISPSLISPAISPGLTDAPSVAASLERRLSDRTWLVIGAAGFATRNRADVPPGSFGVARDDERQLLVSAGVRRSLGRAGAPVEVSALLLLDGGVLDAERRFVSGSGTETVQDVTSWLAGAEAGIAVDRELTGSLSLRVASPLLGARYARTGTRAPGEPEAIASGFVVRALLAPRLELRLAF